MKRIYLSFVVITLVAVSALGAARAFFSDTETSTGNVLAAGEIDLQVDNTSYYNHAVSTATSWTLTDLTIEKFFNFNDVKPGDVGEDTISLHVKTNNAYVCADVTLTSDDENVRTQPEIDAGDVTDGSGSGELADRINFLWWADDGDNVLEDDEETLPAGPIGALNVGQTATVTLADSTQNIWESTPGAVLANETYYIGKAWCFGVLSASPLAQDNFGADSTRTPANSTGGVSCDGSNEGNETQTDTLTADIKFMAVQSRNNTSFVCGQPTVTPTITPTPTSGVTPTVTPTPTPLACTPSWASSVAASNQLLRKNGTAVLATRSDATQALVAQTLGASSDSPVTEGTFYSLGFGGSVTVAFATPIPNRPGADFRIFEVTGGTYPDELMDVFVSPDNVTYTQVANDVARDEDVEMTIPVAQYVRILDVSNPAPFEATADAFDVDGVRALCPTEI
jgi:hypothetical protein